MSKRLNLLITEDFAWDYPTFEAFVEGMCDQILKLPGERIAFPGSSTIETVLTLFAIWKIGKIACPLNTRLPSVKEAITELKASFFIPKMPQNSFKTSTPCRLAWNPNQIASLLFTSGSTGKPKIACHTLANYLYSAEGSNILTPLSSTDIWALTLPLFHVGGLGILFRSYLAKSSVLISSKEWKQATLLSLVPTQLYRLKKQAPSLPNLRTILLGGAPITIELKTFPWKIVPTYGMTEMSSQIVTNHCLNPYAELKLSPAGEVWVRGKVLFKGYLQKDLVLPLNEEGWFETGDLGLWEKKGSFKIIGRKDHLFISGGENIQPEEIEEKIHRLEGGREAIVVPIPDEEFGSKPVVFLKDPSYFKKIERELLDLLPKYKIPYKAFSLPSEGKTLKPNRKKLAKLAKTNEGL